MHQKVIQTTPTKIKKIDVFTDAALSREKASTGLFNDSKLYNAFNYKDGLPSQPKADSSVTQPHHYSGLITTLLVR